MKTPQVEALPGMTPLGLKPAHEFEPACQCPACGSRLLARAANRCAVGLAPAKPARKRKAPSVATMERWMMNGMAKATDGCNVEPDGTCAHGRPSWLIKLGLI